MECQVGRILEIYPERVYIKRGTLFEEFLYSFFLIKPFRFRKAERSHELNLMKFHPGNAFPKRNYFLLKVLSSETVSFFLPFFLREERTLRPLADAILSRKPCLFFLFLFEGWYVRFISFPCLPYKIRGANLLSIYWIYKAMHIDFLILFDLSLKSTFLINQT